MKKKIIVISIFIIIFILFLFFPRKKQEEITLLEETEEKVEIKEELKDEKAEQKFEIKGEVNNPGVYVFEKNERVIDAINKAGGLKENANTNIINLSKKIKDEMVIIIYSNEEIEKISEEKSKYEVVKIECTCPDSTNEACIEENIIEKEEEITKNNQIININSASKEELMTLPSIGEAKAIKIIEYRNTEEFKNIEDIKNVSGIGDALFEKIKDYITI